DVQRTEHDGKKRLCSARASEESDPSKGIYYNCGEKLQCNTDVNRRIQKAEKSNGPDVPVRMKPDEQLWQNGKECYPEGSDNFSPRSHVLSERSRGGRQSLATLAVSSIGSSVRPEWIYPRLKIPALFVYEIKMPVLLSAIHVHQG